MFYVFVNWNRINPDYFKLNLRKKNFDLYLVQINLLQSGKKLLKTLARRIGGFFIERGKEADSPDIKEKNQLRQSSNTNPFVVVL